MAARKTNSWKLLNVGDRFVSLQGSAYTVIKVMSAREVLVQFDSGYSCTRSASQVKSGVVKDKFMPILYDRGFVGDGDYNYKENKREYTLWTNMMMRAYCASYKKVNPTYTDVDVCKEWHNFQNFAKWCNGLKHFHTNIIPVNLDKDIINPGNKLYCPDMCDIVPYVLNTAFVGAKTSKGYYFHPKGYYVSRIRMYGKIHNLGYFKDKESATNAYNKMKSKYLLELANTYRDFIKEETFNSLTKEI